MVIYYQAERLTLRLVRTPKVINLIKELSPEAILVAFKLEVGATKAELAEAAKKILRSSDADFVLANDLRTVERGQHTAYILDRDGNFRGPLKGKQTIARALLAAVRDMLSG